MKYNRSFTLIELLVVIAIIGLLASIVVVNVNSAREKAKIAKSIQFSSSIYHALGAEAVGYWDFNEILPGNIVRDISGNGNNGTLVNGLALVDSLVFSGGSLGKALSFDGVDGYVDAGNAASLQPLNQFTYEAWIYPKAATLWQSIVVTKYFKRLSLGSTGRQLYLDVAFDEEYDRAWSTDANIIPLNQWSHVVATYTVGDPKIYLNGQLVASAFTYGVGNPKSIGSTNVGIGWNPVEENQWFNGTIDEVRIYATALSSAEIQKHYAGGLEKHQNLAVK